MHFSPAQQIGIELHPNVLVCHIDLVESEVWFDESNSAISCMSYKGAYRSWGRQWDNTKVIFARRLVVNCVVYCLLATMTSGGVYLLTEKSMLMGRWSSPENVHDRKDRQNEGVAMSFQRFYGNTLNIKPVLHWEECTIFRRHVMQGEDSRQEMGPGPSVSMRVKMQKPKARPMHLRHPRRNLHQ